MSVEETLKNMQQLLTMIKDTPNFENEEINQLYQHYVDQNLLLINDILSTSLDHLKRLQKSKAANDIICMRAHLVNDINHKVSLSSKRFLNASLGPRLDYNEWLKEHCDLATD